MLLKPWKSFVLLAVLVCLFCAIALQAQVTTADLVGTVTDKTGAILPGARVTVKDLGTGMSRNMPTSSAGTYAFTSLPIGAYSVTVEADGFKKFLVSSVRLAAGDRQRVDANMQLGDVREQIEVTAQATALQTDNSTVGGLVTDRAVQDLPVNGRNFIKLVQLAPGATESNQSSFGGGTRPDDRRQTSAISANGQLDSANNFLLDGMDNNERAIATIIVKPSIDALAEVKVETSMYPAEVSRAGGAVINMITKAGSNDFHGTVFEFLRNDKLDAKNWFNVPQAGNPLAGVKPEYRLNQFGGSIGGPIEKNRLFFFADYEGFRRIQGLTQTATVPTACELGQATCNGLTKLGNFSDMTTLIYDPHTHVPFPNNVIPSSAISGVSANYAALYPALPASACTGTSCLFISSPNQTQFAHTADARIDYHESDKDNTYARYSINNTDTFIPDYLPVVKVAGIEVHPNGGPSNVAFPGTAYQRQQSLAFSHTHILRPNLLLQLNTQLARYVTQSTSSNFGKAINDAFGGPVNANSAYPGFSGLALVTESPYAPLGDAFALPTEYWDTNFQYAGSLAWTKGTHTIKFGANLIYRRYSVFQVIYKASFSFSVNQTNSTAGAAGGSGGNAFASMLVGYASSETRNAAMAIPQYRTHEVGGFIQDDWRATHWLTLNLGLRYDIFSPLSEKHDLLANFDPTNAAMLATGQVQQAGKNGYSDTLGFQTQYGDLQPRIGFAATLKNSLVVRGGFGLGYFPNNYASPAYLKNQPITTSYALSQTLGNPTLAFTAPLPVVTPNSPCLVAACGATAVTSVPGATAVNFKWSINYMENLMLEREFSGNVLTVGFIGEQVRHLGRQIGNVNLPLPPNGPGGCGVQTAISLPNPCQPYYSQIPLVSSVQLLLTDGLTNYTGLQAQFQRRLRKGLTFAGSYTLSRSLGDVTGPGQACTSCGQVVNRPGRDYGPIDYMAKNRFTFTANYELPFGQGLKGVAGRVVKGWQVNGVWGRGSGQAFTVTNGSNVQQNSGITSDRPNVVSGAGFNRSIYEWFDITRFALQPWGTAGDEGENTFNMPGNQHIDLSLFKDFQIKESVKLQFRAEGYNVTNSPAFGMPGSAITGWANGVPTSAGNFGRITTMNAYYTPRDIQLALKLLF